MISSVIEHGIESMDMMPDIRAAHDALHAFLYANVYSNSAAKTEDSKAQMLVKRLYEHFRRHLDELPREYMDLADRFTPDRAVCDYIAGMSDDYAVRLYEKLYLPRSWDVR